MGLHAAIGELRPTERAAAGRHRRGDGDGQDGPVAPARGRLAGAGEAGRDHLGRLAPGLPRSRHRDGQGERRGPGAGSASRPRPRRSGRAVQRRRLRGPRPLGARRDRRTRRGGDPRRGTGLYLRAVARGFATDACRATPTSGRGSRPSSRPTGSSRSPIGSWRSRRGSAAGLDLRNPRRVVRALEIAELAGRRSAAGAARLPGPVTWLGLRVEPVVHADWIGARAADQFAAGLLDEARALRERYDPDEPAFSAIGYREAWDVLDGRATVDEADRHRRPTQRGLRQAPADLVPRRARRRLARRLRRSRPSGPTAVEQLLGGP